MATCSDATQLSRIFRVYFTNTKKSDSEDRLDTRPSRSDVVLLWKESHYFGKAVAEDCPDEANFRLDAPQLESKFV
jgi:hypothetical protein